MTENLLEIGGQSLEVWPKQQMLYSLGSPKLLKTTFADADVYHRRLKQRILDLAAVDNSWATLYHTGDFCLPHSHLRGRRNPVK